MRILLCQLRNHGDIIRSFPLIDAIKEIHPDWYIGFTCFQEMVDTCRLSKNIDVVIEHPRFSPVTDIQGGTRILDCSIFQDCVKTVKREYFDVYVDLHGVFQSAMFGAMCNIKTRLGRSIETSKDGATLFYTDVCSITEKEINRMERHFIVFNKLFPEVRPIKKKNVLKDKVVIFSGSSKMGILKRWNTERYVEVANRLGNKYEVVFVLGLEEQDIKDLIERNSKHTIKITTTWIQVEQEIENAKLVIGNDAAYIHLAVWKNIPAIEICGPLSPVINGIWKYGIGETIFYDERCKCPDIWNGICNKSHECMEQISVDMVMNATEKYL
jgi:ADP-heptose:LPS heptosyltransferase